MDHFRALTEEQTSFVASFKTGELTLDAGAQILVEGAHSPHLFTMLDGLAFRSNSLANGRRQVLNFAMPGDLVGLQGSLMGEMQHSAEALTKVRLCVFEKSRLEELFKKHPSLAYDVTWIAAREELILDEHLLSIGQRPALERAAYLFAFLARRGTATGLFERNVKFIPFTQAHVADTLGLSVVHTNKTLKKLAGRGLIHWRDGGCEVLDTEGLCELSGWQDSVTENRPFI